MNYIEQIKGFWRSHEEHSFSSTEIALYFHLLEICNICRWKNPFKRNNAKIRADLGISPNTLSNARNKLAQCGLISFKTRSGNAEVVYTLSNFDKVSSEVTSEVGSGVENAVQTSSKSDEVSSEVNGKVSSEVTSEVDSEVLVAKYKLNKNQTKQKKYPPLSPRGWRKEKIFLIWIWIQ